MPRASRYLLDGYTYHLTHRCHDRRFLLKFREERDAYREWLRIGVKRYGVSVYAYCITSNHTHVVVYVHDREAVARLMQLSAGAVAQALNRRKDQQNSVWEHPYQCTMVQDGAHLLHCLRYVDMNMVRAGKVRHPREWRWCGYDELTGQRNRYRILDVEGLGQRLGLPDTRTLFDLHGREVQEQIEHRLFARQAHWTESLAVGSQDFVIAAESLHDKRRQFTTYPVGNGLTTDTWAVREGSADYSAGSASKVMI
jgi:putative transposase